MSPTGRWTLITFLSILSGAFAGSAAGSQGAEEGAIRGSVTDRQGKPLPHHVARRIADRLRKAKESGACGLKLFKQFGLGYKNPDGKLIKIDNRGNRNNA